MDLARLYHMLGSLVYVLGLRLCEARVGYAMLESFRFFFFFLRYLVPIYFVAIGGIFSLKDTFLAYKLGV